jgi:hypothetical protein
VEVFLNSEPVTVYPDTLTTQEGEIEGADGICYVCVPNGGIRFPLSDLPQKDDVIDVDYFPEDGAGGAGGSDTLVVVLEDPDSIRMMRQRETTSTYVSDGVHESIVSVPEFRVSTLDPLGVLGSLILARTAWPEVTGSFTTVDSTLRTWKPGDAIDLRSAKRNLYSSQDYWRYGQRRDVRVYVQRVQKRFVSSPGEPSGLLYQVTISFSSVADRQAF